MYMKMLRKNIILLIILLYTYPAFSAVKLTGTARNDAIGSIMPSFDFNDILETRLVIDADVSDWKFYGDGRVYAYYGEEAAADGYYDVKLMRSFIRYFSPIGDFTLGKTYINFGNAGTFNIFDSNKNVTFTDLTYDKEGILALEYMFYKDNYFSGKIYGGMYHLDIIDFTPPEYCGGFSFAGNADNFDFGMVANRMGNDRNLTGIYFKGDIEIGVQGAYGLHFDDRFDRYFSEANAGLDYSFLEGHLYLSLLFYMNGTGADTIGDYKYSADYFLSSRYYVYCNLTTMIDEFMSIQVDYFVNALDGSLLVLPSMKYTFLDGLSAQLIFSIPVGIDDQEFSYNRLGYLNFLFRVEGKFKLL